MSGHPRLDLAIEQARLARDAGNHPFGAVLVDADGAVVLGPFEISEARQVHEGFWAG